MTTFGSCHHIVNRDYNDSDYIFDILYAGFLSGEVLLLIL